MWKKEWDDLILNKWGMGMENLKKLIPKSTNDIFGRRIELLKKQGVKKI